MLEDAESGMSRVVRVRVCLTDTANAPAMAPLFDEVFPGPRPVRMFPHISFPDHSTVVDSMAVVDVGVAPR